jgi:hypothetical protein
MFKYAISIAALVSLASIQVATSQDDRATNRSQLEKLRAHLDESVDWYQIAPAEGAEPLKPHIVLRWDNQVRGDGSAVGLTVVWADDTRPHAITAIFPWSGRVTHECDVLARDAKLVGLRDGRLVWQPNASGMDFRPVPKAPPPAESTSRRRLQLKQLAAEFEATMLGWNPDNSDKQELRMLPQWLYRYGREGSECLDGAIFAFVMGTDPEAVLLLEAFRTDENKYQWQFAFARGTSGALEGRWKEEIVWTAEKFPVGNDPARPHITFSEPLPAELVQRQ